MVCGSSSADLRPVGTDQESLGGDPGPSTLFRVPSELRPPILDRGSEWENRRLLVWFAIGLCLVSVGGGVLYFLRYLRVGNEVTALLPRETVAYVHIGPAAKLQESFYNLDMWENTRPVRARLDEHERRLIRDSLLDVGITATLLQELKKDLLETHIAVLQPDSGVRRHGLEHDFLFFLRLGSRATRVLLLQRLLPYFGHAGREAGVDFHIRPALGPGTAPLSLAMFDGLVVLCWGSDGALRQILRNRERGPSKSLNDVEAFRDAFREQGRESDVWGYARRDRLVEVAMHGLMGPRLDEGQRSELVQAVALVPDTAVDGVAFSADLRAGTDPGTLGLYSAKSDAFEELAKETGQRVKRSLSSIPADSILALAATTEDPAALFSAWQGTLLRLLAAVAALGDGSQAERALGGLELEAGVNLARDVWPNLAHELAFALVPRVDPGGGLSLRWLVVLQIYSTRRALESLNRLARAAYAGRGVTGPRYSFRTDDDLVSVSRVSDWGDGTAPAEDEVLCWTARGSSLIVASDCSVVRQSARAEADDARIDQLRVARETLARLPRRNTVVVLAHLRALLETLGSPRGVVDLLSDDYLAVAALTVHSDKVVATSNVSALSLGFLWASGALESEEQGRSHDICKKLEETVCQGLDRKSCREWKRKVGAQPPDVCETGLRTLLNLDERLRR